MHFHFNLANHTPRGRLSLQDLVDVLSAQLQDLGHEVSHADGRAIRSPGINVFFEGFVGGTAERVADLRREGKRYLIVATERPGREASSAEVTADRLQGMAVCGRGADALWALDPQAVPYLLTLGPAAAHAELGHSPRNLRPDSDEPPEFDFGFYGTMTPDRIQAIWALKARGHTVHTVPDVVEGFERDREMQRARVILNTPSQAGAPFSSSRANTALNLRRPIAAMAHDGPTPWRRVVPFVAREDFVETAEAALSNWRAVWLMQYAAFAKELPAGLLAAAIDSTLGATRH